MNLQQSILNRYREKYPAHTLKEIAMATGIQVTRVFRLFNGSEMKISELEAFQKVLNESAKNSITEKLYLLINHSLLSLPENKAQWLYLELNQILKVQSILDKQNSFMTKKIQGA